MLTHIAGDNPGLEMVEYFKGMATEFEKMHAAYGQLADLNDKAFDEALDKAAKIW